MKTIPDSDKLILALDVDDFRQAKHFVDLLYPAVKTFKVGSMLFTGAGPQIIEYINQKGAAVFLDLKFFDIPHTVAQAVRQVVRHKVKMLTLHILGDVEMLRAAQEAVQDEAERLKRERPLLIGVTVLTSKEANFNEVLALARVGLESGLDGIVCSVKEVALLRQEIKRSFFAVTPGIRAKGAAVGDQKRTATAQEAILAGSDFLVIGRPILEAKDPLRAAQGIF